MSRFGRLPSGASSASSSSDSVNESRPPSTFTLPSPHSDHVSGNTSMHNSMVLPGHHNQPPSTPPERRSPPLPAGQNTIANWTRKERTLQGDEAYTAPGRSSAEHLLRAQQSGGNLSAISENPRSSFTAPGLTVSARRNSSQSDIYGATPLSRRSLASAGSQSNIRQPASSNNSLHRLSSQPTSSASPAQPVRPSLTRSSRWATVPNNGATGTARQPLPAPRHRRITNGIRRLLHRPPR